MFKVTTAIRKIHALKARKKVIQGGTSSGKTYGIIPVIYDKCARKKLKATIVAETLPAVKEGALDDFKNFMFDTGRWVEPHWNASSLTYTFANGSRIQFKSFDSVGKAKASGKRDILFLNEANHISFEVADALMVRSKDIYLDFNPDREFWAHTEVLTEPNSEFLLLTFEDNEALPEEIYEELLMKKSKAFYNPDLPYPDIMKTENVKNSYWSNWCLVYVFGQIGNLQGVIFTNWNQVSNIPEDARLVGLGLDFGFTNDPTALIEVYNWNGKRILHEKCYRQGMVNSDIAVLIPNHVMTYADSSEPKSISEISRFNVPIKGVTKGADSIKFGIDVMQRQEYLVTEGSLNLIKELRAYVWKKDKDGNSLNIPIDHDNHAIDAVRYHEMETLGIGMGDIHIL